MLIFINKEGDIVVPPDLVRGEKAGRNAFPLRLYNRWTEH